MCINMAALDSSSAASEDILPSNADSPDNDNVSSETNGKDRAFPVKMRADWFEYFPWLVHDLDKQLLLCKACSANPKANNTFTKGLKVDKFNKYKKSRLTRHDHTAVHRESEAILQVTEKEIFSEELQKKWSDRYPWLILNEERTHFLCSICLSKENEKNQFTDGGCSIRELSQLSSHAKLHMGEKSTGDGLESKQAHRKEEHKMVKVPEKFPCPNCSTVCFTQVHLSFHQQIQHALNTSKCPYCSNECNSVNKLEKHLLRHHMHCKQCPEQDFYTADLLKQHCFEERHQIKYPIQCGLCENMFACYRAARKHLNAEHKTDDKRYTCSHCPNKYKYYGDLFFHDKIHHQVKEVVGPLCESCGREFQSQSHLLLHMASHSEERPHSCDVCDKSFKLPHHLRTHQLTHVDTDPDMQMKHRPHVCDQCGKGFKLPHHLRQHTSTHQAGPAVDKARQRRPRVDGMDGIPLVPARPIKSNPYIGRPKRNVVGLSRLIQIEKKRKIQRLENKKDVEPIDLIQQLADNLCEDLPPSGVEMDASPDSDIDLL